MIIDSTKASFAAALTTILSMDDDQFISAKSTADLDSIFAIHTELDTAARPQRSSSLAHEISC